MSVPKTEKEPKVKSEFAKSTLYVRGIPTSVSNDALLQFFGTVGPVKSAFCIKSNKVNGTIRHISSFYNYYR